MSHRADEGHHMDVRRLGNCSGLCKAFRVSRPRPPPERPAPKPAPTMSTTSLPSYVAPDLARIPSYTAQPQAYEQRLALNILRARPSGEFTKQSKGGGISLRLYDQENNAALPTYGHGTPISGTVEVARPEGVHAVEVKVRARPAFCVYCEREKPNKKHKHPRSRAPSD